MSCQELVELVSDYVDGALPPVVVQEVDAHIQGCHGCAEYIEQVRTTVRLSAAAAAAELEQRPDRDALLAAFRAVTRARRGR
jgi:anti-sigma factor RsiW